MSEGKILGPIPAIVSYTGKKTDTIEVTVDNRKRVIFASLSDEAIKSIEDAVKIRYAIFTDESFRRPITEEALDLLLASKNNKISYNSNLYSLAKQTEHELQYVSSDGHKQKYISIDLSTGKISQSEVEVSINYTKGLYYDESCEVLSEPYWYLTSEIGEDHTGIIGEKVEISKEHPLGYEYIISGPYAISAKQYTVDGKSITAPNDTLQIFNYKNAQVGQVPQKAKSGIIWVNPVTADQMEAAVRAAEQAAINAANAATNAQSAEVQAEVAAAQAERINAKTMEWVNEKFWWGTLEEYNALEQIHEGTFYFVQV